MGAMNLDEKLLSYLCHTDWDLTVGQSNDTPLHRLVEVRRSREGAEESLIGTLAAEKSLVFNEMKNEMLHHACSHGGRGSVKVLMLCYGSRARGRETVILTSGLERLKLMIN